MAGIVTDLHREAKSPKLAATDPESPRPSDTVGGMAFELGGVVADCGRIAPGHRGTLAGGPLVMLPRRV
jgi:hypothetical protein